MATKEERQAQKELKKRMERNEKCANAILEFVVKHDLADGMMSIYFNDKCYRFTEGSTYTIMEYIKGSQYFEYSNDETVSMAFEGGFYQVMNSAWESKNLEALEQEFSALVNQHGFYYELGHAWNLSLYEN